jgi:hypothetical protein
MKHIRELIVAHGQIKFGAETETLPSPIDSILFACPVCGETFISMGQAEECQEQSFDTGGLRVGDIVVVPNAYHNDYALDDPWLAFEIPPDPKAESHLFSRAGYRVPYYVVTAIHAERHNKHRCVVTLATLAGGALHVGWNPANGDGHYAMFRIDGDQHCDLDSYWLEEIGHLLAECDPPESMLNEARALALIGISTRNLL